MGSISSKLQEQQGTDGQCAGQQDLESGSVAAGSGFVADAMAQWKETWNPKQNSVQENSDTQKVAEVEVARHAVEKVQQEEAEQELEGEVPTRKAEQNEAAHKDPDKVNQEDAEKKSKKREAAKEIVEEAALKAAGGFNQEEAEKQGKEDPVGNMAEEAALKILGKVIQEETDKNPNDEENAKNIAGEKGGRKAAEVFDETDKNHKQVVAKNVVKDEAAKKAADKVKQEGSEEKRKEQETAKKFSGEEEVARKTAAKVLDEEAEKKRKGIVAESPEKKEAAQKTVVNVQQEQAKQKHKASKRAQKVAAEEATRKFAKPGNSEDADMNVDGQYVEREIAEASARRAAEDKPMQNEDETLMQEEAEKKLNEQAVAKKVHGEDLESGSVATGSVLFADAMAQWKETSNPKHDSVQKNSDKQKVAEVEAAMHAVEKVQREEAEKKLEVEVAARKTEQNDEAHKDPDNVNQDDAEKKSKSQETTKDIVDEAALKAAEGLNQEEAGKQGKEDPVGKMAEEVALNIVEKVIQEETDRNPNEKENAKHIGGEKNERKAAEVLDEADKNRKQVVEKKVAEDEAAKEVADKVKQEGAEEKRKEQETAKKVSGEDEVARKATMRVPDEEAEKKRKEIAAESPEKKDAAQKTVVNVQQEQAKQKHKTNKRAQKAAVEEATWKSAKPVNQEDADMHVDGQNGAREIAEGSARRAAEDKLTQNEDEKLMHEAAETKLNEQAVAKKVHGEDSESASSTMVSSFHADAMAQLKENLNPKQESAQNWIEKASNENACTQSAATQEATGQAAEKVQQEGAAEQVNQERAEKKFKEQETTKKHSEEEAAKKAAEKMLHEEAENKFKDVATENAERKGAAQKAGKQHKKNKRAQQVANEEASQNPAEQMNPEDAGMNAGGQDVERELAEDSVRREAEEKPTQDEKLETKEVESKLNEQAVATKVCQEMRVKATATKRGGEKCKVLVFDPEDKEFAWKVEFDDGHADWFPIYEIEDCGSASARTGSGVQAVAMAQLKENSNPKQKSAQKLSEKASNKNWGTQKSAKEKADRQAAEKARKAEEEEEILGLDSMLKEASTKIDQAMSVGDDDAGKKTRLGMVAALPCFDPPKRASMGLDTQDSYADVAPCLAKAAPNVVLKRVSTRQEGDLEDNSTTSVTIHSDPGSIQICLGEMRRMMEAEPSHDVDEDRPEPTNVKTLRSARPMEPASKKKRSRYDMSEENEEIATARLKQTACRLNLQSLANLVTMAEPTLQYVVNKKVVILLGKTGVGKSTLIQAIARRRLCRTRYQRASASDTSEHGLEKNVYEALDPLEGFAIGHDQASQTKGIKHFSRVSNETEEEVVYLDSSGYEDTAGVDVDIATSITFRKVAERCRCIRLAVLINCASFLESRGEAIRDLVKLVSSFVQDFSKHKLAFTFLFTHTDVLPEAEGKDVCEVKMKLHGLLADTEKGTDNDRVRLILKWMMHCLKQKFPFVDIFHPDLSDIGALVKAFEQFSPEYEDDEPVAYPAIGLIEEEKPRDVISCGMTAKAISALKIELDRSYQKLGSMLDGNRFTDLQAYSSTLDSLRECVGNDDLHDAFLKATEKVKAHIDKLKREVYVIIDTSTNDVDDFGIQNAMRALRNIATIDALVYLQIGCSASPCVADEALAYLHSQVTMVLQHVETDFGGTTRLLAVGNALRRLQKLQAWAGAHNAFESAADKGMKSVESYVDRALLDVECAWDPEIMVDSLVVLERLRKEIPQLRALGFAAIREIEEACRSGAAKIESVIVSSSQVAKNALNNEGCLLKLGNGETNNKIDFETLHARLHEYRTSVLTLESATRSLSKNESLPELRKLGVSAEHSVLAELNHEFDNFFATLKDKVEHRSLDCALEDHVQSMAWVLEAQTDQQRKQSKGDSLYQEAIKAIASVVHGWCSEFCELFEQVVVLGACDSHRQFMVLEKLHTCIWLDKYLNRGERFVGDKVASFKLKFFTKFTDATLEALTIVRNFLVWPETCLANSNLAHLLSYIRNLCSIRDMYPQITNAQVHFSEGVSNFVNKWRDQQMQILNGCPNELAHLSALPAKELNEMLVVCESLSVIDSVNDACMDVRTRIEDRLSKYRDEINSLMLEAGQYATKHIVITSITLWTSQCWPLFLHKLPSLELLCESARTEVLTQGKAIRASITDSVDHDKPSAQITLLEEACVLDQHIGCLASHEVDALKQMLEMRRVGLDEAFRAQIEACDFSGVRDYIEPMRSSKDKLKKQRFREVVDTVAAIVDAQITHANAQACSGVQVARAVGSLVMANDHVGHLLKQQTSMNIMDAVDKLKTRVKNTFADLLSQFETALKISDYAAMVRQQQAAIAYHAATKHLLSCESYHRAVELFHRADKKIQAVDPMVEAFVSNVSKASQERVDTSDLASELSMLKVAVDQGAQDVEIEQDSWHAQEDSDLACAQWVVTVPQVKVREGKELTTPEIGCLTHGAILKEMQLDGQRLQFELLTGSGPPTGWVTVKITDKALLWRTDSVWKVVGASEKKGAGVQEKADRSSRNIGRLQNGTILHEIALTGDRLHFKNLSEGPGTGWTNVKNDGKEVLVPLCNKVTPSPQALAGHLSFRTISTLYGRAVNTLCLRLNGLQRDLRAASQEKSFHYVIEVYVYLQKELEKGLNGHVNALAFDVKKELENVRSQEQQLNDEYIRHLLRPVDIDDNLVPEFKALHYRASHMFAWYAQTEYEHRKFVLNRQVIEFIDAAESALKHSNFERVGSNACLLQHIRTVLNQHLTDQVRKRSDELRSKVMKSFSALQQDLVAALSRDNIPEFDMLFSRYNKFTQNISSSYDCAGEQHRLHEALFAQIDGKVKGLSRDLDVLDFAAAARGIDMLRQIGHVLTGAFAVYYEDVCKYADDQWLQSINKLCSDYFGGKALSDVGARFYILEIGPHASKSELHNAYRRKCLEHHPDKQLSRGIYRSNPNEIQQRLQQAYETLSKDFDRLREEHNRNMSELFSDLVKKIPTELRKRADESLRLRKYEEVKNLHLALRDLNTVADLIKPRLPVEQVCEGIHTQIKDHVHSIHANVRKYWDKRDLRQLQQEFATLENLSAHFSASPDICPEDWRREITNEVKKEIHHLAQEALGYLKEGERAADGNLMSFALQLILLGRIFDNLPGFKDVAAMEVNIVLETCQDHSWGFQYIFKLGIVLGRGNVGNLDESGKVTSEDQRVGKVLVHSFRQFKDVETLLWHEQTEITQKDISATLKELVSKRMIHGHDPVKLPIATDVLLCGFQKYTTEYERHFHSWRAEQLSLETLAKDTIAEAKKLLPCRTTEWGEVVKAQIPIILAGVAAYFTISKSGESYQRLLNAGSGHGQVMTLNTTTDANPQRVGSKAALKTEHVLQKPHNIQVLTVLRLFGCDSSDDSLKNHIMQIRTGEGKSMILGMCALLFGLLGFRVRCVCYSEYLSQRDFNLFSGLFSAFGVRDRVVYSKITTFSEDQTAAKGNIRAMTLNLLRGEALNSSSFAQAGCGTSAATHGKNDARKQCSSSEARIATSVACASECGGVGTGCDALTLPPLSAHAEEILLVDEVDTFFGQDFYGQTHNQVALLAEPEVVSILHEIWNQRANATKPRQIWHAIKNSDAYNCLLHKFPGWDYLLESEVISMCHDLQHFNNPPYEFDRCEDRIGYKSLDGISFEMVYGYRTAFAYLNEATNQNLRNKDAALQRALQLRVSCGQFSYANINPACILGVSGTVQALGDHEWCVMNRYGIDRYTNMPSVYGHSNFRFLEEHAPITINPSQDEHLMTITEEVIQKIASCRAAVVFFENASRLQEYERSSYFQRIANPNILKENQSTDEKEFVIKKAATSGQATFTTAVFGRGTDFFCNDPQLHENGGMHVVQTFVSSEKTEELQIQGRTARQGKRGTYSMILEAGELNAHLGIDPDTAKRMSSAELYDLLDQKRQELQTKTYQQLDDSLQLATKRDTITHQFFDALLANDRQQAMTVFKELSSIIRKVGKGGISSGKPHHIVFCLDESGSMARDWNDLIRAFHGFLDARQEGHAEDVVSVVQFSSGERLTLRMEPLQTARQKHLDYGGGGTLFKPALRRAMQLFRESESSYSPVLIFMSDGINDDDDCSTDMNQLTTERPDLQFHTIFFAGPSAMFSHLGFPSGDARLSEMANMVPNGAYHLSVDGIELQKTFAAIAVEAEFVSARN